MFTEPNEHHTWLRRMVGNWEYKHTCGQGPEGEPVMTSGTEAISAFSDLWIVGDGEGEIPGVGRMHMRITLGYDPNRGRYIGSWIGSPMGSQFVYEGTREGDVLTLDTTGPSFADPRKTARYQDIIELHGDDRRVLRSRCLGENGSWTEFMQGEYRRVR